MFHLFFVLRVGGGLRNKETAQGDTHTSLDFSGLVPTSFKDQCSRLRKLSLEPCGAKTRLTVHCALELLSRNYFINICVGRLLFEEKVA